MDLQVELTPERAAVVRPLGRIDAESAQDFKADLSRIVGQGHWLVVVDLSKVAFLDSAGLGALISGLKAARLAGGELRLAQMNHQAKLVLEVTCLDRVFYPFATVEQALAGQGLSGKAV